MPLSTRELQMVISARNRATRELKQLSGTLNRVQRDVQKLSRTDAKINVEAETRAAERKIDRMQQRIRELNKTRANSIDIDVETSRAERKIRSLEHELHDLNRFKGIPVVDVQIKRAQQELRDTISLLNEIDRMSPEFELDADTARAQQKLAAVKREINEIARKSPTVKIDVNYNAMYSASRSVARLLALPAIAAGVSILVGAVSSLGAGFVAMASSASQALGVLAALPGLAASGVSAVTALGASMFGVIDAAKALGEADVSSARDSVDAANQRRQAARAVADAQRGLRDAHEAAARQAIQNARTVGDAQRAVADAHRSARQVARQAAQDISDAEGDLAEAYRNRRQVAIDASQSIQDAERAVADAVRNQRTVSVEAARAVADAQRELRDSHRDVSDAMADLHDARQEAIQDLKDMRDAVRDNALTEEGARIGLIEARQELIRLAKDDTSTSLDIRKARLGIAEAEARLSDAMRGSREDARALAQARRDGVRGSEVYQSAQDRLRDAQRGVSDAERGVRDAVREGAQARRDAARATAEAQAALSDTVRQAAQNQADAQREVIQAQKDLQRAHVDAALAMRDADRDVADAERELARARQDAAWASKDAARAIADAQRALADAQRDARLEADKLSSAQEGVADAMRNLSPEQRRFARFINSTIVPALRSMSHAAARQLLPSLERAFTTGLDLLPMVNRHLERTGGILGRLAERGAKMATSGPWKRDFSKVLQNNEKLLRKGGEAGFHFANAFRNISVAALPVTQHFADLVLHTSKVIDRFISAKRESGELGAFFETAWEKAKQLWDMALNVANGVVHIGMAADGPGQRLMNFFERVTERFERFTTSAEGQNAMRKYFNDSVPVVKEFWRLIEDVGEAFLELGSHSNTAGLLRQIRQELLPAVQELLNVTSGAFGRAMIELITNIVKALTVLTQEGGGLMMMVKTLNALAEAFVAVTEVPGLGHVVAVVVGLAGAAAGLGLVVGWIGRLGKAVGGPLLAMGRLGKRITGVGVASRGAHRATAGQGGFIGTLGTIEKKAGGAHRATGRLSSRLRGFGGRAGRFAGIGAAAVALGGIGLAAHKSGNGVEALQYGAMGAMMGMMAGPWGAAVGGAAGALYGMWKETKRTGRGFNFAAAEAKEFKQTLNQTTGAITGATRALAAKKLQQDGAFASSRRLGIQERDMVSAVLGQDRAVRLVNRAYRQGKARLQEMIRSGKTGSKEFRQLSRDLDVTRNTLESMGAHFRRSQGAIRETGRATQTWKQALKGIPPKVITEIRQKGGVQSFKQLMNLKKQYDLTPKEVRTIFKATGIKVTHSQAKALGVQFRKLPEESIKSSSRMRDQFEILRRAVKASGHGLSQHTAQSRNARREFEKSTNTLRGMTLGMLAQGRSVDDIRGAVNKWIPRLKALGGDSDKTRRQIKSLREWVDMLTGSIKDVPDKHNTKVTADTKPAIENIKKFVTNANRSLGNVKDEQVNVRGKWSVNKKSGGITIDTLTERIHSGRGRIPERAMGGPINGPGTGTSDDVLIRASNGEFVQKAAAVAREGVDKMAALNEGKATIVPKYAAGGPVVHGSKLDPTANMTVPARGVKNTARDMTQLRKSMAVGVQRTLKERMDAFLEMIKAMASGGGDMTPNEVARGVKFARKQHGKPYIWGGVGPRGYDCSGYQSAVYNAAVGKNPYTRLFTTSTLGSFGPLQKGKGAYTVGWFTGNPGHVSGRIGNLKVESTGDHVRVGAGARAPEDNMFNRLGHLTTAAGRRLFGGSYFGPRGEYDAGSARGIVRNVAARRGWDTGEQWRSLSKLINSESGWRPYAANPSSSARGLFQKMTSIHGPLEKTIAGQAKWGLGYIKSRYGGPIAAWRFKQANNWYRKGGLVRDQGGLLPRGPSVVQNNTGGNEHLSVLNKSHMKGLDALAGFARGGVIQTRVRPRLNRVAGRRDIAQAYAKNEGIKEFREFLREELIKALTGSPGQVRASKSAVKKQLGAVEDAIIEGLQKQSTRLEKQRKRIGERMEKLDETHHKRSNALQRKANKVRDRLEDMQEKGRHGKLSRQKERIEKKIENLDKDATKKERERLHKRAKELGDRIDRIEDTGAQKRLRKRIADIKNRQNRVEKEENKEIKQARKRMEERVSDITRKLVDVRRREAKDIEKAHKQFDKLLPRMQKQMQKEYRVLENYSERLVKMNKRLTKARATLAARTNIRDEFAASVREGVRSFASILGVAPQGEDNFLFTATYVEQQMQAKLNEVERFQANLALLAQRGLSDDLYKQFSEAGVEGAGAMVAALAAGTPDNVSAINDMQRDINAAADSLGSQTSRHLYQAGVNAAQSIVKGIEQNIRQLERSASKLARALVRAIKRALGIRSPSSIGKEIGANLRHSVDVGWEDEDKRSKPPGFDPKGFTPPTPPGGGYAPGKTIKVEQTIYTQEIDPRKHAADLGYEFARRIGD